MTKLEMIEAMLEGKTLKCGKGCLAYYDPAETYPFIYKDSRGTEPLMSWNLEWRVEKPKNTRPMTRDEVLGFLAHTPGIVVRNKDVHYWTHPGNFDYSRNDCLWATISPEGIIGEAKQFEKEVEG